ncbi:MAG: hypothetical protein ACRCZ0_01870 [Cetobacterium sp.]
MKLELSEKLVDVLVKSLEVESNILMEELQREKSINRDKNAIIDRMIGERTNLQIKICDLEAEIEKQMERASKLLKNYELIGAENEQLELDKKVYASATAELMSKYELATAMNRAMLEKTE